MASQRRLLISVIILLVCCLDSGQALPQNQPPEALKAADVIAYLKETIDWYRGTAVEQQIANEPSDIAYLSENRGTSGQIVRLAFEFARLEEQNESKQPEAGQAQGQGNAPSQYQRLVQAAASADQKVEQSQKELQSLRKRLETAPEKNRPALDSLIAETQSELAFQQARRDALRNLLQFASETSAKELGAVGLRGQIEELARSVPASLSGSSAAAPEQAGTEQTSPKPSPSLKKEQPSGIWGLATDLFRLSRKKRALDRQIQSTDHLMQTVTNLRLPLVSILRDLIQTGDQLSNQPDSSNPATLAQQKKQLDALTLRFKEASSGLLPLSKQQIMLDVYKRTLANWRDAVRMEYADEMRSFLVRMGVLVMIIAAVFVAGEFWRRAIFRYVREPRRRYQFLLFREIMTGVAVAVIIVITFATELGSVVTFAGLLTAGVAVAMQSVILSVAGYFFLMGKYGVRVGDRVQIGNVTGEVVDIGLVRLHLLELTGGGTEAQPSGRVVAFSNSVVFQPTSGVFKKIPGTSFVWHEISLTFSAENDYRLIQERIARAVDIALKDHREEIVRQGRHMEQTLNAISAIELKPETRLHFTTSGIEVTVRFPVEFRNAVDIDHHMMREVNAAIEQEPALKLAGSGAPTLRTNVATPKAS